MTNNNINPQHKRYGLLIVHGIGEQGRFEFLESIATSLFKALRQDPDKQPHLQLRHGDQDARYSSQQCLYHSPLLLRWRTAADQFTELDFREVHWADLDEKMNMWRWLKLVGWALAIPGLRFYKQSGQESSALSGMRLPRQLSWYRNLQARLRLFVISFIFFLMLISIDILHWLLTRLSFQASWVTRSRNLIYDYLGDVKLYQDWYRREDDDMQVVGEKSRSAIRRRMVQALVQLAEDVDAGRLDGYYIFSHSLGSVIAFNGLMEHAHTLPNYLTAAQWQQLPARFKTQIQAQNLQQKMTRRPDWLTDTDAIDRDQLFAGLRGVLTMGSPINKFAALWPAIVPVNTQPLPGGRPWYNVSDSQDIVAGAVTLFDGDNGQGNDIISGLHLKNIEWVDQPIIFTAHTSYWHSKNTSRQRLVNGIIDWLQDKPLPAPKNKMPSALATIWYWLSLGTMSLLPLLIVSYLIWLAQYQLGNIIQIVTQAALTRQPFIDWFALLWESLFAVDLATLTSIMLLTIVVGSGIILCFSVIRRIWEQIKFG